MFFKVRNLYQGRAPSRFAQVNYMKWFPSPIKGFLQHHQKTYPSKSTRPSKEREKAQPAFTHFLARAGSRLLDGGVAHVAVVAVKTDPAGAGGGV